MTIRLTRDGQEIGQHHPFRPGRHRSARLCLQGCRLREPGPGLGQRCDRVHSRGGWRFIESWFRAVDVTPQLDVDEAKYRRL